MERNTKYKPEHLCIVIFTLCLSVRFVEYFLIETDKTAIGQGGIEIYELNTTINTKHARVAYGGNPIY